jgi:hypothetical protein
MKPLTRSTYFAGNNVPLLASVISWSARDQREGGCSLLGVSPEGLPCLLRSAVYQQEGDFVLDWPWQERKARRTVVS